MGAHQSLGVHDRPGQVVLRRVDVHLVPVLLGRQIIHLEDGNKALALLVVLDLVHSPAATRHDTARVGTW